MHALLILNGLKTVLSYHQFLLMNFIFKSDFIRGVHLLTTQIRKRI